MKRTIEAKLFFLFFLLVLTLIWQFSDTSFIISKPIDVIKQIFIFLTSKYFWKNLISSSIRVYLSIFLSLIIGVLIGTAGYFNKTYGKFLDLVSYPTQFIASATLTIILIMIFGLSDIVPVWVITIIILPNIFVATKIGMQNLRKDLIEVGKVYSTSKWTTFKNIMFPQIKPYILSGLIRANAVAWKIVVTAEIFIATSGLGYMLNTYFRTLNTAKLFALAIIILFLGLGTDKIIKYMASDKGVINA